MRPKFERITVKGGVLIPHTQYKTTQDDTIYLHYTCIAHGSGDIEEFKTEGAARWWLEMDSMMYA